MPARKPAPEVPALTSTLALLQLVAGPEMMAAALPILRERMALTPEKLALLLVRALNPDELIQKGEESTLRGVGDVALRDYKEQRLLPQYIGMNIPSGASADRIPKRPPGIPHI